MLISTQLQVSALEHKIDTMKQNIEVQKIENSQTQQLLNIEEDEEYVERIARDKLGLCYPDEKILIDRSGS